MSILCGQWSNPLAAVITYVINSSLLMRSLDFSLKNEKNTVAEYMRAKLEINYQQDISITRRQTERERKKL